MLTFLVRKIHSLSLCAVNLILILILQVLHQFLHVAKLCLLNQLLPKVVDVALKNIVHVTVSCILLLQGVPFGFQNLTLLLQAPYLTDEGSKLFLLLAAHGLDVRVSICSFSWLHRA